jgi:hypothetical protein
VPATGKWFFGLVRRLLIFLGSVLTAAQGIAWLFALDDEFHAAVREDRFLVLIVLGVSIVAFAMYDWLEEHDR